MTEMKREATVRASWPGQPFGPAGAMTSGRNAGLLLVILTSLLPVFWNFAQPHDADLSWRLASAIGQTGIVLLVWQQALGFRGVVGRVVPDWLWVSRLHRRLAIGGVLLVFGHPVLMAVAKDQPFVDFLLPSFRDERNLYLSLGKFALLVMAFAWITSAVLRARLGFRLWKRLHGVNYLVLPLAFLHSLTLGPSLEDGPLRAYWYSLAGVSGALLLFRMLYVAGVGQARYVIAAVTRVAPGTTRLTFLPLARALDPAPGQFIYAQTRRFGESHPFTVSHFDEDSREVSITVRSLGRFSRMLQDLHVGDAVWLDGPYGVFTREAYTTDRPVVLVAGGIGITPFLRLIGCRGATAESRAVTLVYGNRTEQDIAYRDELAQVSAANLSARVVHVLSEVSADTPSGDGFETGRVDARLLQKHLTEPWCRYEFFLCGPPPMMASVTEFLTQHGAEPGSIHIERFAV